MATIHVVVGQSVHRLQACDGARLSEVLRDAGFLTEAPCGGRGTCGKCRVLADGREVLACRTLVRDGMQVEPAAEDRGTAILSDGPASPILPDGRDAYGIAFDVGTTTLVAYLLDGATGAVLSTASCLNPQKQFGADVISRIQYAQRGGAERLRIVISQALSDLSRQTARAAGIRTEQVTAACAVGNTAMHHLLLGIETDTLTAPPYMPKVFEACTLAAGPLIPALPNAALRVLPNIAGFVGADTVSCMEAVSFDRQEQLTLLLDIGTNGEMVLGDRHRRIACSTAAGPAFEGANIACGMRGALGAIDHVSEQDGELNCHVIGETAAAGLCGSGLIDAVHHLLKRGQIAANGRITSSLCTRDAKGHKILMLRDNVYLSQLDIRQVQLAKSAIRAGIELMAQQLNVRTEDIQQVLLAGAFGNYMDPVSACGIGLLPACLLDRIVHVGNAAGAGAQACALREQAFLHAVTLAKETEFLELAALPSFQDTYLRYLNF